MIRVAYYCGAYDLNKPPSSGDDDYGDCGAEGETSLDISQEDWNEGFGSMECPRCGNDIRQGEGLELKDDGEA